MDFNTNLKIGVVFGVPVKYTRLRSAWEVKPKRVDKDLEMTEEDFLQISFFFQDPDFRFYLFVVKRLLVKLILVYYMYQPITPNLFALEQMTKFSALNSEHVSLCSTRVMLVHHVMCFFSCVQHSFKLNK